MVFIQCPFAMTQSTFSSFCFLYSFSTVIVVFALVYVLYNNSRVTLVFFSQNAPNPLPRRTPLCKEAEATIFLMDRQVGHGCAPTLFSPNECVPHPI
jgi:hypothetical protein